MKIVLAAFPEMGHFTPIVRLAKYLSDKGHDIHIITFVYNKEKVDTMIKNSEVNCQIHYFDEDDPMPRECIFKGLSWKTRGVETVAIGEFEDFYPKI
jgi:UDP-N-acetylglucosamine:LPS N-acetylglucosamine transferase